MILQTEYEEDCFNNCDVINECHEVENTAMVLLYVKMC
jgi:hypothetical protein